MPSGNSSLHRSVLILIAPGFEEETIVSCLGRMREAGIAVSLVGLSAGLVSSEHGMVVRPDFSLDQLAPTMSPALVIVPGGTQCISALLTDPRVHRLIETTSTKGGMVAATLTAQSLLAGAGIPGTAVASRFVRQDEQDITEFVQQLIHLVAV